MALPAAPLIKVKDELYGTTEVGGADGHGTVFSITPSGTEKTLHSFYNSKTGSDGAYPTASLIDVNGTLYGTTQNGGTDNTCSGGCGTVFSITPGGTEKVLHSFGKGSDGAHPAASLIEVNSTLYGTTERGGAYGHGTVFRITPDGMEKVLHSFGKGTDGATPLASLIAVNGTLYGTTQNGGTGNTCNGGCGTLFRITPSGAEKVLHNFGNAPDGANPVAPLIELKGKLYGTTYAGGRSPSCGQSCGTVFSITTRGTEKVLHNFGLTETDGGPPTAGLIVMTGTLYGTTTFGGKYGWGMLFALTP